MVALVASSWRGWQRPAGPRAGICVEGLPDGDGAGAPRARREDRPQLRAAAPEARGAGFQARGRAGAHGQAEQRGGRLGHLAREACADRSRRATLPFTRCPRGLSRPGPAQCGARLPRRGAWRLAGEQRPRARSARCCAAGGAAGAAAHQPQELLGSRRQGRQGAARRAGGVFRGRAEGVARLVGWRERLAVVSGAGLQVGCVSLPQRGRALAGGAAVQACGRELGGFQRGA
mmetsp:Transcript_98610/g.303953  ORF Transcript_98610/g.303953 Transcript_98610/m.303953 type:complete len:232 (-) Transcript_98610:553-1248(-)